MTSMTNDQLREQMSREYVANREHNMVAFEDSDMPAAARRGVVAATHQHLRRVVSIERHTTHIEWKNVDRHCWIVITATEEGFCREGWIIGPRGAAKKAF